MQTCSKCHSQTSDSNIFCPHCQADLREFSVTSVVAQKLKNNPRVSTIRVTVAEDSCPACQQNRGDYQKDSLPVLPTPGCSHENGCHCFYEPALNEIYP